MTYLTPTIILLEQILLFPFIIDSLQAINIQFCSVFANTWKVGNIFTIYLYSQSPAE